MKIYSMSITAIHSSYATRLTLLCYVQHVGINFKQCNLGFLYHSANYQGTPKISGKDRDYSANSTVAGSNWLITKLSKEGRIWEARKVFEEMPERDVVTWTTVITGYIKCGMIDEALRLFDREDAKKNVVTWTALVSGYVRLNRIEEAKRLFDAMPVKNVISWNTMMDGYLRRGCIDLACDTFETMPERNIVSWNTIITALGQCGRVDEAWKLFDMMPERDVISWTAILVGLSKDGRIDEARNVFNVMPERNIVSWNAMITGYAQNARLNEAFDLFERMPERDLTSWNTMMTGYIQNEKLDMARDLFSKMPRKNVITWTSMISGCVQDGQSEEALKIFVEMLSESNIKPNEGTFVSILGACSDLAGLSEGQQIHQRISKTKYCENTFVVSSLINMYSKCGELYMARKIFEDGLMSHKDLVYWNGMIAAYAHHGRGKEAIKLFDDMTKSRLKPNDVTYVGLLSACSHSGLVEEGLKYFDRLVKDGSIKVREDHYSCLIDLCSRSGRLEEAFGYMEQLENPCSASLWGALLAGCNVHGNTNIGKLVAEKILEADPENAGSFMLLSNIYASTGKWREAAKMRSKMKDRGLKKQPGCSWIEVGNMVNVFRVGDDSHTQSENIYSLLQNIHSEMNIWYANYIDDGTEVGSLSGHEARVEEIPKCLVSSLDLVQQSI